MRSRRIEMGEEKKCAPAKQVNWKQSISDKSSEVWLSTVCTVYFPITTTAAQLRFYRNRFFFAFSFFSLYLFLFALVNGLCLSSNITNGLTLACCVLCEWVECRRTVECSTRWFVQHPLFLCQQLRQQNIENNQFMSAIYVYFRHCNFWCKKSCSNFCDCWRRF